MKKRMLALLFVFVLLVAAGCGKEELESKVKEDKGEPATEDIAKEQTSDERLTISVMGVDWGFGPLANSEMEIYWEDMYDVNLDIQWVSYQDYAQKLNTMISTNSQPDVVQIYKVANSYYYPVFTQAIDAGNFVDMTPYLFDGGKGMAETNAVMKNWDNSFWDQTKYQDGIYILPRSKGERGMNSGIQVRKDLMEKYGYTDEPTTMEELKEWLIGLSKAATEGEGKKIYALDFFDNAGKGLMDDRVLAFAIAFTGQTDWEINSDGVFEFIQFDENYIEFLNWMKDLYEAGVLDREFALGNADTSKWKAGNSVAYLAQWYNWNQSADLTSNKIFESGLPDTYKAWGLLPVKGPKAYTVSPNPTDVDQCIAISSSVSDEKLRKIMDVFNGTEEAYPGYDMIMKFGVEGVHYNLLDDGTIDNFSDESMKGKRTEGYVGAWNQIFLKTDANQVVDKFERAGQARASEENIERAYEIRNFVYGNLDETQMRNAIMNLQSPTYDTQWSILTDDVNTIATQYVMGQISEQQWIDFVDGIVQSSDYKKIQQEFKEASGK